MIELIICINEHKSNVCDNPSLEVMTGCIPLLVKKGTDIKIQDVEKLHKYLTSERDLNRLPCLHGDIVESLSGYMNKYKEFSIIFMKEWPEILRSVHRKYNMYDHELVDSYCYAQRISEESSQILFITRFIYYYIDKMIESKTIDAQDSNEYYANALVLIKNLVELLITTYGDGPCCKIGDVYPFFRNVIEFYLPKDDKISHAALWFIDTVQEQITHDCYDGKHSTVESIFNHFVGDPLKKLIERTGSSNVDKKKTTSTD
ncbi:hypothetical protein RF11_01980 [Thelohanellus kitauei]|uniref:Uncharacterized protein n=1 Tax=Thelohanellus kitauei TaxID=669202 RepID=A0A0C2IRB9_THEKT|nr:hypothetical protein RF11_01980 [Thelohanellus kitauei]